MRAKGMYVGKRMSRDRNAPKRSGCLREARRGYLIADIHGVRTR